MTDSGQLYLIELLLSIAGFLILFLLGIIGFWIQKMDPVNRCPDRSTQQSQNPVRGHPGNRGRNQKTVRFPMYIL